MMRRNLIALAAAGIVFGTPSMPANAQVFIDPDSPTAKEYAIPLEGARQDAASGSGDDLPIEQGERSAPLFGEGVEAQKESAKSTRRNGISSARQNGGSSSSGIESDGTGTTSAGAGRSFVATVPQGGFSETATIGAVAFSVLLLGGVVGSIVRRRDI